MYHNHRSSNKFLGGHAAVKGIRSSFFSVSFSYILWAETIWMNEGLVVLVRAGDDWQMWGKSVSSARTFFRSLALPLEIFLRILKDLLRDSSVRQIRERRKNGQTRRKKGNKAIE